MDWYYYNEMRYELLYKTQELLVLAKKYDKNLKVNLKFILPRLPLRNIIKFKEFLAFLSKNSRYKVESKNKNVIFSCIGHPYTFLSFFFLDLSSSKVEINSRSLQMAQVSISCTFKDLNLGVKPSFEVPDNFLLSINWAGFAPLLNCLVGRFRIK